METRIGKCIDCGSVESHDCPLYICEDGEFLVVCCIVYAVLKHLYIIQIMDGLLGYDD